MLIHEAKIRVRYVETDQMGIAHHSNYLHWFEVARLEYLQALGFRFRDLEDQGVRLAVVEAYCRYRTSVRYDDSLVVKTWLQRLKRFKLDYAYHIYNERGDFVAEGFTVLGSIDDKGKPRPIPSTVEAALLKASQGDGPRVLRS